jgi:hypothetical protein
MSRIGQNADCPNVLAERLYVTIDRAYRDTGQKVDLVGYSLGVLWPGSGRSLSPRVQ